MGLEGSRWLYEQSPREVVIFAFVIPASYQPGLRCCFVVLKAIAAGFVDGR